MKTSHSRYKPASSPFFARIPDYWSESQIKAIGLLKGGSGFPDDYQGIADGPLPFFKVKALERSPLYLSRADADDTVEPDVARHLGATVFPANTIVFAKVGAALLLTRFRLLAQPSCIDNNMMGLRITLPGVSSRFIVYASNLLDFLYIVNPGAVPSVNSSQVGVQTLPVPPETEQKHIVEFLDRATARSDALIAKYERIIELLEEKRTALVTEAVTKGLDPTVTMKDSGIGWFPQIPRHWGVVRLKHILSNIKAGPFGSSLTKEMYVSCGYRVYGQEQVIPGDFAVGDYYITAEKYREFKQYQVAPGDILVSCVGTFGKVAIVPPGIEAGIINPRLLRLRCLPTVDGQFLLALLRSSVVFEQFASLSRGGTMDIINIGILSDIQLPFPNYPSRSASRTLFKRSRPGSVVLRKGRGGPRAFYAKGVRLLLLPPSLDKSTYARIEQRKRGFPPNGRSPERENL